MLYKDQLASGELNEALLSGDAVVEGKNPLRYVKETITFRRMKNPLMGVLIGYAYPSNAATVESQ